MNKTYLIVGGTAVVSLAAGGAAGYYLATKKATAELEAMIAKEAAAAKKHYSHEMLIGIEKARAEMLEKFSDVDILEDDEADADILDEDREPELSPEDLQTIANGKKALIDYSGMAGQEKPPLTELVPNNIFDGANSGSPQPMPPRDERGKFMSRPNPAPQQIKKAEPTPYKISEEDFMINEPEHDQENCWYFVNENTLIQIVDQEVVEIPVVGEVNLTLFPPAEGDAPRSIYVRNEALQKDFDITLTEDSLSDFAGLSEH